MISIFDYTDYRTYLEDFYREKKAATPSFSYQVMADKAGFNNRGFVYNIVRGKKALSKSNCFKLSTALDHNRYEADYFENMVALKQAKGLNERNHFFERLSRIKIRGKGFTQAQLVRRDQYEFYSKWYHCAVRSIIDMHPFKDDFKWLARMVHPAISVRQARQSVALLERLGMIARTKNGTYKLTNKSISSGQDIVGLAVGNFHAECTSLAEKAIRELPRDQRHVTGLTLGISKSAYNRICQETLAFQQKIMDIANSDEQADTVYQYNFHLFPLSKSVGERKNT